MTWSWPLTNFRKRYEVTHARLADTGDASASSGSNRPEELMLVIRVIGTHDGIDHPTVVTLKCRSFDSRSGR